MPNESRGRKLSNPLLAGLIQVTPLVLVTIFLMVREFRNERYDWDVDHEIYFGQELLRGSLIWVAEFHDKLPILQMLFGIAATGDPLTNWRVMSLSAALISVGVVLFLLPRIHQETGGNLEEGKQIAVWASAWYLLLAAGMPWGGGITHINVFATSMAMISLLSAYAFATACPGRFSAAVWLLVATSSAVLSISVRPYFLLPLAVGYLWVARRILVATGRLPREKWIRILLLVGFPAFFGTVANSLPYAFAGNLRGFFDGLAFLSRPARGSTTETFRTLLTPGDQFSYFAVTLVVMVCVVIASLVNQLVTSSAAKSSFTSLLIPLSFTVLAATIAIAHFWSHYVDMFGWYLAIFASQILLQISRSIRSQLARIPGHTVMSPARLTGIGVVIVAALVGGVAGSTRGFSSQHPLEPETLAIENYLKVQDKSEHFFLAPLNMHAHWRLEQPRHGFPHAANTEHLLSGRWENVETQAAFLSPKNLDEYCELLQMSKVRMVFLHPDSPLNSCFKNPRTLWSGEPVGLAPEGSLTAWTR